MVWPTWEWSATRTFPKDSFERNLLPEAVEIEPKTRHAVLHSQTQNVAERCEPKVFSPWVEERVPLMLLQCLMSMDLGKPCWRKHLAGTEM